MKVWLHLSREERIQSAYWIHTPLQKSFKKWNLYFQKGPALAMVIHLFKIG